MFGAEVRSKVSTILDGQEGVTVEAEWHVVLGTVVSGVAGNQ